MSTIMRFINSMEISSEREQESHREEAQNSPYCCRCAKLPAIMIAPSASRTQAFEKELETGSSLKGDRVGLSLLAILDSEIISNISNFSPEMTKEMLTDISICDSKEQLKQIKLNT